MVSPEALDAREALPRPAAASTAGRAGVQGRGARTPAAPAPPGGAARKLLAGCVVESASRVPPLVRGVGRFKFQGGVYA